MTEQAIPGIHLGEPLPCSLHSRLYQAKRSDDGTLVLLMQLPPKSRQQAIDSLRHDHMLSIVLSQKSEQILKPQDFISATQGSYLIYDYFQGIPLAGLLQQQDLTAEEVIHIALELADALDYIHRQNIIHRNLSTNNILIDLATLEIKLSDFRYALNSISDVAPFSNPESLDLQLDYIAPELTGRIDKNADYRSDYYSLGCILYELCSSSPPFSSDDPLEIIHGHIARKVSSLHNITANRFPSILASIIEKLLSKMPDERYQSIAGLKFDLQHCLQQLNNNENPGDIGLGTNDFSTLFTLPNRLYGRTQEITTLKDMLHKATQGKGGFISISGHAGSGKSALVTRLIEEDKNQLLFAAGKYEQFEQHTPYRAFIQIIEQLTTHLLGETDSSFNYYRDKLISSLGNNISVICDLSAHFESIVGKQSKPLSLGANETRNRLISALSILFSVFSQPNRPLVLFMDDLQWADQASLLLLRALVKQPSWSQYTLYIGSYRHDEIGEHYELQALLEALRPLDDNVEISLQNLQLTDISNLLKDTLHSEAKRLQPLAQHIYRITAGNAFYIRHLIENMYREGMIWAEPQNRIWNWSNKQLEPHNQVAGIQGLVTDNLGILTKQQLLILQYGHILGSSFTLSDLSMVMEQTEEKILLQTPRLLDFGFITRNGSLYRYSHDYIQRSVAETLTQSQQQELHLNVAQQLLKHLSDTAKESRQFEITNHLNSAAALINSSDDYNTLILYNYRSASSALNNSAYKTALDYIDKAMQTLYRVETRIQNQYDFDIKILMARCLYLNTQHKQAKKIISQLLDSSKTLIEKSLCYSVYKDILISEGGEYHEAVIIGLNILSQQNIHVSLKQNELQQSISELSQKINILLGKKSIKELLKQAELNDPEKIRLLALLADLWEAAYYDANEPLMRYMGLLIVSISIQYGNSSESSFGYVLYGHILTTEGNFQRAYEFGNLALKLNTKFNDRLMLPKVTNLFCNYTNFHTNSYADSAELYATSSTIGRENGDYLFGLWASLFVVWSRFLAGRNLHEIEKQSVELEAFIHQTHDDKIIYVYEVLKNIMRSLRGVNSKNELNSTEFSQYVDYWYENNFTPGISWHAILLGQYYCLMGNYQQAYQLLAQDELVLTPGIIMFPHTQHHFYYPLSILRLLNREEISLTDKHTEIISRSIDTLSLWAQHCPENFLYQKYLLAAERAQLDGELWDASSLYSQAIEAARDYQLEPALALCNELAGEFWLKQNNNSLADFHYQSALQHYAAWGANHKVETLNALIRRHEKLPHNSQEMTKNLLGNENISHAFDLDYNSILKFTHTLSEEINITSLLNKTMEIIMENAGADKGALVIIEGDKLYLRVIAEYRNKAIIKTKSIPVDESHEIPLRIIHYVNRTREQIIIGDARTSNQFLDIQYLKTNPIHAALCMPVIYKDNIVAILYLENSSSSNVFSEQRSNTLRIVLAQMAISLQNASLYLSLQSELEKHRTTANALQDSELRLRLSHEYSNIGVWDWDIITNDLYWSENIGPLLGYPSGEIESSYENFINVIHPDDRKLTEDAIQACFEGEEYLVQHRVVWPDGTIRWVQEAGDVTRDEDGKPVRMLGIVSDITEAKHNANERLRLEKQLQQSHKMEAIGQLTGGIAHDFNNILASVIGFSELIQSQIKHYDDSKIDYYLGQVISSARRATELVAQMLAFSRHTDVTKENIDPVQLVNETIRMLSSTIPSSIILDFSYDEDIANITVNPVQLNQVIMNICINARDAFDEHGKIELSLHTRSSFSATCSSCHTPFSGSYIELSIKDNAGGIPRPIRESIFNPFFTTKEVGKGTGMGLAMVHGILHGHNAHLVLDIDEGCGSNFRIFLPVSSTTPAIEDSTKTEIQSRVLKRDYKVLIIDDEPSIIDLLKEVFSQSGATVNTFTNSRSALQHIKTQLSDYDIMITDQTMPDISGTDLASEARKIDPDFPIILCTGYSDVVNETVAADLGIARMLYKPVSPSRLIATVAELLN